MKKILFITRPITPPWDEASKNFAFDLAKKVPEFEITILTCGFIPNLPQNVKQKPIYTSGKLSYLQKIRLIKHLRKMKNDFDIFHFIFTPTKLNSFLIKKCAGIGKNTKTIQTIATLREDLLSDTQLKNILFADTIVTYSKYAEEKLVQLGFSNVKQIYPGIDLERYRPKEKKSEILEKYGFREDDFVINFTGEYSRLNAIDDVIKAFIEVNKKIKNAKLSLAVRIKNKKDAQKKREIIRVLQSANLTDKVAFHDDQQHDMGDIYNLCDISLFPVRNMKGKFDIPLAVVEAMACGKPVILSDIPILGELNDGKNSLIVRAGDTEGLVDKIMLLYNDKALRQSIGEAAQNFAQKFDIKKTAENYTKIYKELL